MLQNGFVCSKYIFEINFTVTIVWNARETGDIDGSKNKKMSEKVKKC